MATFLLSVLIFGSAGYIIYSRVKKGKNCDDCHTTCPVKKASSAEK
ncbi:FeoB-associated Cys-rich membrane protein [Enterococcus sp. DIV0660C]|nr:FeoB-associated Cys-rich membrane protein [Enterococcus sp. DIV0660C]MBO0432324.1 FeoB-associated Cys-rich membrane protein [Enterococcus sp. DIV0660C]